MAISTVHSSESNVSYNNKKHYLTNIFFIDDNRADNYLIKSYIQLDNIPVIPHFELNALHAIDYLSTLEISDFPDIIFVDVNMPLKDGFEFVEDFLLLFPDAETSVYIMSSSIRPSDKEKIDKYDIIKAYAEKPITSKFINQLISKLP